MESYMQAAIEEARRRLAEGGAFRSARCPQGIGRTAAEQGVYRADAHLHNRKTGNCGMRTSVYEQFSQPLLFRLKDSGR